MFTIQLSSGIEIIQPIMYIIDIQQSLQSKHVKRYKESNNEYKEESD